MYKMEFDLRNKKDAVYMREVADAVMIIEDWDMKCKLYLGCENFEELENQYRENMGEISYRKLEEKYEHILEENRKLKAMMAKKELFDEIRMEKLSSDIF